MPSSLYSRYKDEDNVMFLCIRLYTPCVKTKTQRHSSIDKDKIIEIVAVCYVMYTRVTCLAERQGNELENWANRYIHPFTEVNCNTHNLL